MPPKLRRVELARQIHDDAGREMTQNFENMNANTALAAGTLAAVLAVLGTGELFAGSASGLPREQGVPKLSSVSLIVLTVALPLQLRFFFRALIAYQNFIRFRCIQSAARSYMFGNAVWNYFRLIVDTYLESWCSPLSLWRLTVAKAKYGFFWIFVIHIAALIWAFVTSQGAEARIVSALILGTGLGWEMAILPKFRKDFFTLPSAEVTCELLALEKA